MPMTKPVWRIRVVPNGWVHDIVGGRPVLTDRWDEAAWWDRKDEVDAVIAHLLDPRAGVRTSRYNTNSGSARPYTAEPGPPLVPPAQT